MKHTKLQILGILCFCCALVIVILALGPIASTQGKIRSDPELSATFGGACDIDCNTYTTCLFLTTCTKLADNQSSLLKPVYSRSIDVKGVSK